MGLDRSQRLFTQGLLLAAPWAKKGAPDGADGVLQVIPEEKRPGQMKFAEPRASLATGKTASEHTVPPCDADIFLEPQARP